MPDAKFKVWLQERAHLVGVDLDIAWDGAALVAEFDAALRSKIRNVSALRQ